VDLGPVEIRVLGCLIEKQRTTPDAYPLTLNGLRLACNQSTNRDPVVDYDESEIRAALERLARRRFVRLASGHTTRATKYRHLLDDTLSLDAASLALLGVLMLRGPQTPGELKQRTERLHRFADLDADADDEDVAAQPSPQSPVPMTAAAAAPSTDPLLDRVEALEQQLSEVRAELADLREQLGG
jgi:uncharacterized protein YceH (UPF0502 family)